MYIRDAPKHIYVIYNSEHITISFKEPKFVNGLSVNMLIFFNLNLIFILSIKSFTSHEKMCQILMSQCDISIGGCHNVM